MSSLIDELVCYAIQLYKQITPEQIEDLVHLASYHECGLCASRGYGKTMLTVLYETFMAERNWTVCHMVKIENQAKQWHQWMIYFGWDTTQWRAWRGNAVIDLRLYRQGRGPRYDVIVNDEVGTIVLPLETRQFNYSQEMLSGSKLGKACWTGTQDVNSVWSKCPRQKVRGYDPVIMPWVKRQYESAKKRNPAWYMDLEYHCKATPAGGLVLTNIVVEDHNYTSSSYGIDSNPEEGYFVCGSHRVGKRNYLCEAYMFETLSKLADFVRRHQHMHIELETNGVGGVVKNYLIENNLSVIPIHVTDDIKTTRVNDLACITSVIPHKYEELVLPTLIKQIWGPDKKIVKFSDAHWFDSYYLSCQQGESDLDIVGDAEVNSDDWYSALRNANSMSYQ